MVEHGFYNFLNWFDDTAWYPLGRIVGGTVWVTVFVWIHWNGYTGQLMSSVCRAFNTQIDCRCTELWHNIMEGGGVWFNWDEKIKISSIDSAVPCIQHLKFGLNQDN